MEILTEKPQRDIKEHVWNNYKMRYSQDKRGFWLIVRYKLKVIENIAEKIKQVFISS